MSSDLRSSLLMLAAGSTRPDPGPARSWVERELSRPAYHESLAERLSSWLGDLWDRLQAAALGASALSTAAAVLVVLVLVVLVVLVAGRVRREPVPRRGPDAGLGAGQVPPEEHRGAAETALRAGDVDLAVVEAFRAVAARAVQRGALPERPGRTAHELAAELGPAFPAHAEELTRASALFDQVFYGRQPAAPDEARSVLDLDDALRGARPVRAPAVPCETTGSAPR